VDARVAELVELGATISRRYPADFPDELEGDFYFVTMLDPEGNEFCVA
jgi:hypothetical protein